MEKLSLVKLYKKHIRGTSEKAPVVPLCIHLCTLTNAVKIALCIQCQKIYITTRVLKHLYDSKPAEEFEFLLRNMGVIVKYPDHLYQNKSNKRGTHLFTKTIKNMLYACSIETTADKNPDEKEDGMIYVVTGFRVFFSL